MYIIIITILILLAARNRFLPYKKEINTAIVVLSVWLIVGSILRHFLGDRPPHRYTDVEMAQNLIKEDKEFKKAKMKILDDGSVRISVKKRKFLLKDGVLASVR